MPNAMYGISRFEDAVKLLDEKDAEIARLRDALNGLLDFIEMDKLPMNRDALDIAYRAAGRPLPRHYPHSTSRP